MTRARREASNTDVPPRSYTRCYLAFGMVGSLAAALLGLVFEQQAVFAAGLACFGLKRRVLIATCKQLVWSIRRGRNMPI